MAPGSKLDSNATTAVTCAVSLAPASDSQLQTLTLLFFQNNDEVKRKFLDYLFTVIDELPEEINDKTIIYPAQETLFGAVLKAAHKLGSEEPVVKRWFSKSFVKHTLRPILNLKAIALSTTEEKKHYITAVLIRFVLLYVQHYGGYLHRDDLENKFSLLADVGDDIQSYLGPAPTKKVGGKALFHDYSHNGAERERLETILLACIEALPLKHYKAISMVNEFFNDIHPLDIVKENNPTATTAAASVRMLPTPDDAMSFSDNNTTDEQFVSAAASRDASKRSATTQDQQKTATSSKEERKKQKAALDNKPRQSVPVKAAAAASGALDLSVSRAGSARSNLPTPSSLVAADSSREQSVAGSVARDRASSTASLSTVSESTVAGSPPIANSNSTNQACKTTSQSATRLQQPGAATVAAGATDAVVRPPPPAPAAPQRQPPSSVLFNPRLLEPKQEEGAPVGPRVVVGKQVNVFSRNVPRNRTIANTTKPAAAAVAATHDNAQAASNSTINTNNQNQAQATAAPASGDAVTPLRAVKTEPGSAAGVAATAAVAARAPGGTPAAAAAAAVAGHSNAPPPSASGNNNNDAENSDTSRSSRNSTGGSSSDGSGQALLTPKREKNQPANDEPAVAVASEESDSDIPKRSIALKWATAKNDPTFAFLIKSFYNDLYTIVGQSVMPRDGFMNVELRVLHTFYTEKFKFDSVKKSSIDPLAIAYVLAKTATPPSHEEFLKQNRDKIAGLAVHFLTWLRGLTAVGNDAADNSIITESIEQLSVTRQYNTGDMSTSILADQRMLDLMLRITLPRLKPLTPLPKLNFLSFTCRLCNMRDIPDVTGHFSVCPKVRKQRNDAENLTKSGYTEEQINAELPLIGVGNTIDLVYQCPLCPASTTASANEGEMPSNQFLLSHIGLHFRQHHSVFELAVLHDICDESKDAADTVLEAYIGNVKGRHPVTIMCDECDDEKVFRHMRRYVRHILPPLAMIDEFKMPKPSEHARPPEADTSVDYYRELCWNRFMQKVNSCDILHCCRRFGVKRRLPLFVEPGKKGVTLPLQDSFVLVCRANTNSLREAITTIPASSATPPNLRVPLAQVDMLVTGVQPHDPASAAGAVLRSMTGPAAAAPPQQVLMAGGPRMALTNYPNLHNMLAGVNAVAVTTSTTVPSAMGEQQVSASGGFFGQSHQQPNNNVQKHQYPNVHGLHGGGAAHSSNAAVAAAVGTDSSRVGQSPTVQQQQQVPFGHYQGGGTVMQVGNNAAQLQQQQSVMPAQYHTTPPPPFPHGAVQTPGQQQHPLTQQQLLQQCYQTNLSFSVPTNQQQQQHRMTSMYGFGHQQQQQHNIHQQQLQQQQVRAPPSYNNNHQAASSAGMPNPTPQQQQHQPQQQQQQHRQNQMPSQQQQQHQQ